MNRHSRTAGIFKSFLNSIPTYRMIVAFAGRRIDARENEVTSFPLKNIVRVRNQLKDIFLRLHPSFLVCSGSCGADLLALDIAGQLGIERMLVLPYDRDLFKALSVDDRPGKWGSLFDRIYDEVKRERNVYILNAGNSKINAYRKANREILNHAGLLAHRAGDVHSIVVVIAWEMRNKGRNDITAHFKKEAERRKFRIEEIDTLHEA